MSWETRKLSECCVSITDGDHLPPPKAETGIPFVTIANIADNQFDYSDTMFVPEEYYDKLDSKRKASVGDVLYSVVGSFGIPVLIKEQKAFVFQRHIAILRPTLFDRAMDTGRQVIVLLPVNKEREKAGRKYERRQASRTSQA